MDHEKIRKNILILSYNWKHRGGLSHAEVKQKLSRDHIEWDRHNIVYVNWGKESFTDTVADNICSVTYKAPQASIFRIAAK